MKFSSTPYFFKFVSLFLARVSSRPAVDFFPYFSMLFSLIFLCMSELCKGYSTPYFCRFVFFILEEISGHLVGLSTPYLVINVFLMESLTVFDPMAYSHPYLSLQVFFFFSDTSGSWAMLSTPYLSFTDFCQRETHSSLLFWTISVIFSFCEHRPQVRLVFFKKYNIDICVTCPHTLQVNSTF